MFRYKQLSEFNLYLILYTSYSHGYMYFIAEKKNTNVTAPEAPPRKSVSGGKGFCDECCHWTIWGAGSSHQRYKTGNVHK